MGHAQRPEAAPSRGHGVTPGRPVMGGTPDRGHGDAVLIRNLAQRIDRTVAGEMPKAVVGIDVENAGCLATDVDVG